MIKYTEEEIEQMNEMRLQGMSLSAIGREFGTYPEKIKRLVTVECETQAKSKAKEFLGLMEEMSKQYKTMKQIANATGLSESIVSYTMRKYNIIGGIERRTEDKKKAILGNRSIDYLVARFGGSYKTMKRYAYKVKQEARLKKKLEENKAEENNKKAIKPSKPIVPYKLKTPKERIKEAQIKAPTRWKPAKEEGRGSTVQGTGNSSRISLR